MDYAKNTNVSIDKSQQEITKLLRKAGAEKCMQGWDGDTAFVAFVLDGLPIRQKVAMPKREEFSRTDTGKSRKQNMIITAWEQACKQRMREFCLLLKAKLVAVAIGLRPIEQEFYADICLPTEEGTKTIFEYQGHELKDILSAGKLKPLLPGI